MILRRRKARSGACEGAGCTGREKLGGGTCARARILLRRGLGAAMLLAAAAGCPLLRAQAGPDTLLLTSGEKLIGRLERDTGTAVTFQSDALGELTVSWSKVRQLDAAEPFAAVRKGVKLRKNANVSAIPQGTVAATAQSVRLTPQTGPAATVPVGDMAYLVNGAEFHEAVTSSPGFLQGWKGTVTAGAALIEATQHSVSFNAGVAVTRAIPQQTWLEPRNRTSAGFTAAYGKLSEPGAPTVKTSIYSATAERDEYFSPQLYGVGKAEFDHNFSQGLDLQQIYGGGVGWTLIRSAAETLDVQALVNYQRQSFQVASQNQNLIGSLFAEIYNRTFADKITLNQQAGINPAWNHTRAYSANASLLAGFPIYKQFSLTTGVVDAYLNDPPPGFKKNSFQFTTGLSYTLP